MSLCRKKTHKIAFAIALIMFLSGCFFSVDGACFIKQGVAVAVSDMNHQHELSTRDEIKLAVCQIKSNNWISAHSFPAVLFKIALIPCVVVIAVFVVTCQMFQALKRIVSYVHASDGKKELVHA